MEYPRRNVQQTAGNIRRQEGFGFRIEALSAINVSGYFEKPKETLTLYKSYSPELVSLSREGGMS